MTHALHTVTERSTLTSAATVDNCARNRKKCFFASYDCPEMSATCVVPIFRTPTSARATARSDRLRTGKSGNPDKETQW